MRAIVMKRFGGPEVLQIEERPDPQAKPGHVVVDVKGFGLNHAEIYFRKGAWGDVAEISGIECVGVVRSDPDGRFAPGQKVMALVGGLGRNINGSYAEQVCVPTSNVVAVDSDLSWEHLAAIPESYATAWTALVGILALTKNQTVAIRAATSALGQAALNIAVNAGAQVIATTRNPARAATLEQLGAAQVLVESPALAQRVRDRYPLGIDSVLDIVGNTTVLDSLAMLKRVGHVCLVGFLGGGGPLAVEPVFQVPSGRHLTVFAQRARYWDPRIPTRRNSFSNDCRSRRGRSLQGQASKSLCLRGHPGRPPADGVKPSRRQNRDPPIAGGYLLAP
jgi:NADPH:quinone reductase